MIVVVIPCYRVGTRVLELLPRIDPTVGRIIVVDDDCPINTGQLVSKNCNDSRVEVITHTANKGVGGAVLTGYRRALEL